MSLGEGGACLIFLLGTRLLITKTQALAAPPFVSLPEVSISGDTVKIYSDYELNIS